MCQNLVFRIICDSSRVVQRHPIRKELKRIKFNAFPPTATSAHRQSAPTFLGPSAWIPSQRCFNHQSDHWTTEGQCYNRVTSHTESRGTVLPSSASGGGPSSSPPPGWSARGAGGRVIVEDVSSGEPPGGGRGRAADGRQVVVSRDVAVDGEVVVVLRVPLRHVAEGTAFSA